MLNATIVTGLACAPPSAIEGIDLNYILLILCAAGLLLGASWLFKKYRVIPMTLSAFLAWLSYILFSTQKIYTSYPAPTSATSTNITEMFPELGYRAIQAPQYTVAFKDAYTPAIAHVLLIIAVLITVCFAAALVTTLITKRKRQQQQHREEGAHPK